MGSDDAPAVGIAEVEQVIQRRVYRFRLAPTPEQVTRLEAWQAALRWLWNVALEQYISMGKRRCRIDRTWPSFFQQALELTELRAEFPWLADVPVALCQQVLKDLEAAWKLCWRAGGRVGAPNFKSKKRGARVGMRYPNGNNYAIDFAPAVDPERRRGRERIGHLDFPKIGRIEGVFYRPLVGKQKSCALTFERGEWWCSILAEREVDDTVPMTGPAVAIDRGVVNLIADSDRRIVENPRFGEASAKRLARAQRAYRRKQKGSKNREKAVLKGAKIRRRVRHQREHLLHVESKRYASENHAAVIVEDLNIVGMTASAKGTVAEPGVNVRQKAGLNRAILDSGWGRLADLLTYKTAERGGRVVKVVAAYSSQTCSVCGVVDAASRREQGVFLCTACGHFDNADINAAQVLLARGNSVLAGDVPVTACGGSPARGAPTKQGRGAAKRRTAREGDLPVRSEASPDNVMDSTKDVSASLRSGSTWRRREYQRRAAP